MRSKPAILLFILWLSLIVVGCNETNGTTFTPVITRIIGTATPETTIETTMSTTLVETPTTPTLTPGITPTNSPIPLTISSTPTNILSLGYIKRLNCDIISFMAKYMMEKAAPGLLVTLEEYPHKAELFSGLNNEEFDLTLCYWSLEDSGDADNSNPYFRNEAGEDSLVWQIYSPNYENIANIPREIPNDFQVVVVQDRDVEGPDKVKDQLLQGFNDYLQDLPDPFTPSQIAKIRISILPPEAINVVDGLIVLPEGHWLIDNNHENWRRVNTDALGIGFVSRLDIGRLYLAYNADDSGRNPLQRVCPNINFYILPEHFQAVIFQVTHNSNGEAGIEEIVRNYVNTNMSYPDPCDNSS